jgi:3-methyladenine DNA glycosylase AlkD
VAVRAGVAEIRTRLRALGDSDLAAFSQRFFKTGPGEYGERDRFLGIRVPVLRRIAREFRTAPFEAASALLRSPMHEERLVALFLLVHRFARGSEAERERIYREYLKRIRTCVNNWDLVDSSARDIVGARLEDRDRSVLNKLARSPNIWERRVAIIATHRFIRRRDFGDTLAIAKTLLSDREDLIHKATGWMLREVGNRDRAVEERFLRAHYREMPRTMLRYAIEKLPERRRRAYLEGRVG